MVSFLKKIWVKAENTIGADRTQKMKPFFAYLSSKFGFLSDFKGLSYGEFKMYHSPNWYHDFGILGIKTPQYEQGNYYAAQLAKQEVLFDYIKEGIQLQKKLTPDAKVNGIELFCADGFYSNFSVQNGADQMLAIDIEDESGEGKKRGSVLDQGRLASKLLKNDKKITFANENVFHFEGNYNFCLCFGGMYHIENPRELLEKLSRQINGVLVIQTIVSMENEDENYFETPCPGWDWGCRFSHAYLLKMVRETGWEILKESRNEISSNHRLCDKGSSYVLCVPAKS